MDRFDFRAEKKDKSYSLKSEMVKLWTIQVVFLCLLIWKAYCYGKSSFYLFIVVKLCYVEENLDILRFVLSAQQH